MTDELYNRFGCERISDRQINELVGLARGIVADGAINQAEADSLQKWLASNVGISNHPNIGTLYPPRQSDARRRHFRRRLPALCIKRTKGI